MGRRAYCRCGYLVEAVGVRVLAHRPDDERGVGVLRTARKKGRCGQPALEVLALYKQILLKEARIVTAYAVTFSQAPSRLFAENCVPPSFDHR